MGSCNEISVDESDDGEEGLSDAEERSQDLDSNTSWMASSVGPQLTISPVSTHLASLSPCSPLLRDSNTEDAVAGNASERTIQLLRFPSPLRLRSEAECLSTGVLVIRVPPLFTDEPYSPVNDKSARLSVSAFAHCLDNYKPERVRLVVDSGLSQPPSDAVAMGQLLRKHKQAIENSPLGRAISKLRNKAAPHPQITLQIAGCNPRMTDALEECLEFTTTT